VNLIFTCQLLLQVECESSMYHFFFPSKSAPNYNIALLFQRKDLPLHLMYRVKVD